MKAITLTFLAATLLLSACEPRQYSGNGIQYHYIQRTPVQLQTYTPQLYFPPVAPPQPLQLNPVPPYTPPTTINIYRY